MNEAKENPKAAWLSLRDHKPQGAMVLKRGPRPGGGMYLSLWYRAKDGHYVDCGGSAASTDPSELYEFMEVPE